jgi:hypothetical protein
MTIAYDITHTDLESFGGKMPIFNSEESVWAFHLSTVCCGWRVSNSSQALRGGTEFTSNGPQLSLASRSRAFRIADKKLWKQGSRSLLFATICRRAVMGERSKRGGLINPCLKMDFHIRCSWQLAAQPVLFCVP